MMFDMILGGCFLAMLIFVLVINSIHSRKINMIIQRVKPTHYPVADFKDTLKPLISLLEFEFEKILVEKFTDVYDVDKYEIFLSFGGDTKTINHLSGIIARLEARVSNNLRKQYATIYSEDTLLEFISEWVFNRVKDVSLTIDAEMKHNKDWDVEDILMKFRYNSEVNVSTFFVKPKE